MFKKVKHLETKYLFTAKDESGRDVTIDESISFIFTVEADESKVNYRAVDFHDTAILDQMVKYFTGKPFKKAVIDTIVIRYGWMDKGLNKLEFLPFMELIEKHHDKTATSTDKRKLGAVLKQLCISKKRVTVI